LQTKQRTVEAETQLAESTERFDALITVYRVLQKERADAGKEQEELVKNLEAALRQAHGDLGAAQEEVNRLAAAAQDWELVHTTTRTEPDSRPREGSAQVAGDLPQTPKPEVTRPVSGHSSLGASHAYKIKEADEVHVPDFPNLVSLPQWRAQLLNNLAQASGRPDDQVVMKWVQEALNDLKSFDDLGEVGDMSLTQLDSKLGLAMNAMLIRSGEKSRDIRDNLNRHMLDYARKGRVLRGRQIAHAGVPEDGGPVRARVLLDPSRGGRHRE
jgi:hypothetical protein